MLTFWGNIEETDISAYAATLILPSYMSHLQRAPFRFAAQRCDNSGEQPLTLTCTGPGRIEQFELSPREHALNLLCHTCPGLLRDRVQLPRNGAIWSWPVPEPGKIPPHDSPVVMTTDHADDDAEENPPVMRLFFRPTTETLDEQRIFPPEKAYLSISRNEVFLHIDVVAAYFQAWFNALGMSEDGENLTCRVTACGFLAESPYLTVEATVTQNDVFADVLRFAGLSRWLEQLEHVRPDLDAEDTVINDRGLRIPLKIAES